MKFRRILFTLLFCLAFTNKAAAQIVFEIKNEQNPKAKILFFGFNTTDEYVRQDSYEIFDRIERNLKTTNLFETSATMEMLQTVDNQGVDPSLRTQPQQISTFNEEGKELKKAVPASVSVEMLPDFNFYNRMQVSAIIVAQFNYDFEGNLEMRVRMWDVLDERQLFGKFYSASKDNYKKIANVLSDEIFKAITNERAGHFDSKIAYIAEYGEAKKRIKKLVVMDYDGENRRYLTGGGDLVLTPVFARDPDELFYLRYYRNRPQIFKLNMRSMRNQEVGSFNGTTFAASPHPSDANRVLLSAIIDGNSDIYELYLSENRAIRLTNSPAIDATASYAPDGNSIIFISDRDSGQQIYTMNLKGRAVEKLTNGAGSYAKPIYSPDGKMIAFTRIKNGQFYIGTMSTNSKNERLLASGYLVEGAKFSPNGRYLIYSKKKTAYGQSSIPGLYVIDIATGFEREIALPIGEGATDPDWI